MAKITRAVKSVKSLGKATANKRATKVVTTGRDSKTKTAPTMRKVGTKPTGAKSPSIKDAPKDRKYTYEMYMREKTLDANQAKDFIQICEKRPMTSETKTRTSRSIDRLDQLAAQSSISADHKAEYKYRYKDMVTEWGKYCERTLKEAIRSGGEPYYIERAVQGLKEVAFVKLHHKKR